MSDQDGSCIDLLAILDFSPECNNRAMFKLLGTEDEKYFLMQSLEAIYSILFVLLFRHSDSLGFFL